MTTQLVTGCTQDEKLARETQLATAQKTNTAIKHSVVGSVNVRTIITDLKTNQKPTEHGARVYLTELHKENRLPPSLARIYNSAPQTVAYMLSEAARLAPIDESISRGIDYQFNIQAMLDMAFLIHTNKKLLTDNLFFTPHIDRDLIRDTAIMHGVDPSYVTSASAATTKTHRITPLLESASVSIFNRKQSDKAKIQYKETTSNEWLQGADLKWNSLDNALSGSIVYLKEDSDYDLKITIESDGVTEPDLLYSFSTWPSQPNFDPNKVYDLKDIYFGGQLDLEALQIEGNPDGWAKIIGSNDTPIIIENNEYNSAINIGSNSYIYFENITVQGGRLNAISSNKSHDLWFNGCDISGFGRSPNYIVNGIAYEDHSAASPINYDSAFSLYNTGRVVIENCVVHSPISNANNWGSGHPYGPNAFLAMAQHPDFSLSGQTIIRNNRFFGTHEHRFNDVIESRSNGSTTGGFVRDSAIYNNYLAYANDDIIELDGGQNNVLFYNNEIEQGYVGVSLIPNRKGPSYVFNNYIHNLGDDRDKKWAAIKMGGLLSRPDGVSNIYNNFIRTWANGIASAGFDGDYTFWVNAINNVMVHNKHWQVMGYSIYDKELHQGSRFINNFMFNLQMNEPVYRADNVVEFYDPSLVNTSFASSLWQQEKSYISLPIPDVYQVPNFTSYDDDGKVIVGKYQHCQPLDIGSLILLGATNTDGKGSASNLNLTNAHASLFDEGEIDNGDILVTHTQANNGATDVLFHSSSKSSHYKEAKITNNDAHVTVSNIVDFDINNNNDCGSYINIKAAKRGNLQTGKGNDTIEIAIRTTSAYWSNLFTLNTGDGNDSITFNPGENSQYSSITVEMGNGDDIIETSSLQAPAKSSNIERILSGGDGNDVLITNNPSDLHYSGFEGIVTLQPATLTIDQSLLKANSSEANQLLIYGFDLKFNASDIVSLELKPLAEPDAEFTELLGKSLLKYPLIDTDFYLVDLTTSDGVYHLYIDNNTIIDGLK